MKCEESGKWEWICLSFPYRSKTTFCQKCSEETSGFYKWVDCPFYKKIENKILRYGFILFHKENGIDI